MKYIKILLLFLMLTSFSNKNKPIQDLISRVTKGTAKNISICISASKTKEDYFEISKENKRLKIKGNNIISITTGFNWYLKYIAKKHISWNNLQEKLPSQLPLPDSLIRKTTNEHIRYYLNNCTFSYSMAFWGWDRWQKEIDWMALHGVTMALDIVGNETVWHNILQKIGYSIEQINQFIAGPAYQAWFQMNNLEGWGGPNSESWYNRQAILQKKIIARMHELGIEPVLPGYIGMAPSNIDKKLGYKTNNPGKWNSFQRPAFLNPTDPHFKKIARLYYLEMEKLYGKVKYYSMDPFHEGGNTDGIELEKVGKSIMSAMKRANRNAVWVIQAWQANPRVEMIKNIEQHDLLILDLNSEERPQWGDINSPWYRPNGFEKHDWIYCMLLNFGGRVGLHGRIDKVINGYYKAHSDIRGEHLLGVGVTAEAIENNPIMYELLYELPWRNSKFDKYKWLKQYTYSRYGKTNTFIEKAWHILANCSYNCPTDYPGEGTIESVFCARPKINPQKACTWGSTKMYYNPSMTQRAAKLFLKAAPKFQNNNNFEYDLVDIMRQALSDKANTIMQHITRDYNTKDVVALKKHSDNFLRIMKYQNTLLATRTEFRVGTWINEARKAGITSEEKDRNERYARTLITVWGPREASEQGALHDYSSREWNGLLSDLYYKRWKLFFSSVIKSMSENKKIKSIDFFTIDSNWANSKNHYEDKPSGNSVSIATAIYKKVFGQ